ncbi:unnamed protein product [Sphagnum jensenii]|uniref:Thioredoxin domain-containing protein n=1 Tax=Sphagnum jensenii TaxID=128206 RepID=A0ABP1AGU0_9BRYO
MAVALLPQTPWRVVVLSRGSTALFPSRIPLPHVLTRNPLHTGFASHTKEWRSCETRAGIHIDRRRHFDELWRRQEEGEAREAEAEVTCPIDCVREVRNLAEFERVLLNAESTNQLVVVDFYNSSCGACKYILPRFIKLCKGGCGEECPVEHKKSIHFVKHNVHDEYDDLTDIAQFYSIRHVPLFSFFVDGSRVDQFSTRDQHRLEEYIFGLLARYHE